MRDGFLMYLHSRHLLLSSSSGISADGLANISHPLKNNTEIKVLTYRVLRIGFAPKRELTTKFITISSFIL